jgi:hypothetical protein
MIIVVFTGGVQAKKQEKWNEQERERPTTVYGQKVLRKVQSGKSGRSAEEKAE